MTMAIMPTEFDNTGELAKVLAGIPRVMKRPKETTLPHCPTRKHGWEYVHTFERDGWYSNGHIVFDGAADPKFAADILKRIEDGRLQEARNPHPTSESRLKLIASQSSGTIEVKPIGYYTDWSPGKTGWVEWGYFVSVNAAKPFIVVLQAAYYAMMTERYGTDEFRCAGDHCPVLAYKQGKLIALCMPVRMN